MSYQAALAAAGATVLVFEEFGSYQGDWLARVQLQDGREGWVRGSYGSCSGCDAFLGEFGYSNDPESEEYKVRLKAFGEGYLDSLWTKDEVLKFAREHEEWDSGAEAMVTFIQRQEEA